MVESPTSDLQCIHRAGCTKPKVCGEVGHCTSMTETDLKLHADMSREEVDAVMNRTAAARSSNERVAISAEGSELMMELFNRMPIESLGSVPEPIAKRIGDFMVANGYRIVFNRWYLQADPKAPERSADETSDKPVAWRYLADSAYEQRPRWVYFEENTPTVRLVAEGRTLEPLYSRGSPEEPSELPEALRDPIKNLERGRELLKEWGPTPVTDAALAESKESPLARAVRIARGDTGPPTEPVRFAEKASASHVHVWEKRGDFGGASCKCGTRADGWYCPDSPDHLCHYEKGNFDQCDFCGLPEERK